MRKFNAIKNAVNFGKGKKMSIQVNDKVQWVAFKGMEDVVMKGCVENIGEVLGVKTFTIRKFPSKRFTPFSSYSIP